MNKPVEFPPELPNVLAEIAEVAGVTAALQLSRARAGNTVYIPLPESLTPDHWLVGIVGMEAATAIATRFSSDQISIPLAGNGARGSVWRALRAAISEGRKTGEAARLVGVSDRTIRRHRNGHSGQVVTDLRQGKLFK
jgi:hypothetical protein